MKAYVPFVLSWSQIKINHERISGRQVIAVKKSVRLHENEVQLIFIGALTVDTMPLEAKPEMVLSWNFQGSIIKCFATGINQFKEIL